MPCNGSWRCPFISTKGDLSVNFLKIMIVFILTSITMLIMTACDQQSSNTRKMIEKDGKTITILQPPKQQENIAVSHIENIDDTLATQFFSETKVILNTPKNLGANSSESSLYIYDMNTKTKTLLKSEFKLQNYSLLSPDKKHLFLFMDDGERMVRYIMDIQTKKTISLGNSDMVNNVQWLDHSHVIFSTLNGDILKADVDGNVRKITSTKDAILSIGISNKKIYFVDINYHLFSVDGNSKPFLIKNHISSVIPSPDGSQLALVQRTNDTTEELILTDLKGRNPIKLASGIGILGTNWAPNGRKIAFNLFSEDNSKRGLYVVDTLTGEMNPILLNVQYPKYNIRIPVSWSESNKKIMITTFDQNKMITNIILLK